MPRNADKNETFSERNNLSFRSLIYGSIAMKKKTTASPPKQRVEKYLRIKNLPTKVREAFNQYKVQYISPDKLKRHSVSSYFHDLSEEELNDLATSIKQITVRDPILLFGNEVVAGWQQCRACQIAKVQAPIIQLPLEAEPFLLQFALASNFERLPSDSGRRAMIAAMAEGDLIKQGAEKRAQNLKQNAAKNTRATTGLNAPDTAEILTAEYNTNEQYIKEAIWLKAHADQKTIDDVMSGRRRLYQVCKEERLRIRKAPGVSIPDFNEGPLTIIPNDPLAYIEKLPADEAQIIAIECPVLKNLKEFDRFAVLVSHALKPGGMFLCTFVGEVERLVDRCFRTRTLKPLTDGFIAFDPETSQTPQPEMPRRFQLYTKCTPGVSFAKLQPAPPQIQSFYHSSVVICGTELQSWRALLKLYVLDSYVVIVPFAGYGTATAACVELGRKCIAIEADPEEVKRLKGLVAFLTFSLDEIKDLSGIVNRLRQQSDPVSAFLWRRFSTSDRVMMTNYQPSELSSKHAQDVVLQALNTQIWEPSIFEKARFKGVLLRPETTDLRKQSPIGSSLARLNRLLLEDAYPVELSRNPKLVSSKAS